MESLNYAVEYQQALAQQFPYVLYFGALFATPNNGRYQWINSDTIKVPTITTTGRVDGDRDTIGTMTRNYSNAWTTLTLSNHRTWQTLVHPRDIDETHLAVSINNITKVFNDEQKFPEMNCYLVSKLYADWIAGGNTANTTALSEDNVLEVIDDMMKAMDEARVPRAGRILYATPEAKTYINNAKQIYRTMSLQDANGKVKRGITALDELEIPASVPSDMMKTVYDFTSGWAVDSSAQQINLFMVHPDAVITPISYEFAQLDPPSAGSQGKYNYFEESFEDVFIMPHRAASLAFNVTA